MSKIKEHQKLLQDPDFRKRLLADFRPTFCFDKAEQNFPCFPEAYLQNVIQVKLDEYQHIKQRQKRELTQDEQKEFHIIKKYFWKDGKFNADYESELKNNAVFKQDLLGVPGLLIFNEKKYGYKTGEKIDIKGSVFKDSAPLSSSVIPTKEGFFIQYGYNYAVSNSILGLGWIRNLLPYKFIKLFPKKYKEIPNTAFHYGDAEKAGVHVKMDDGKLMFSSLQTWAHGRRYAEKRSANKCTFDKDGHVKVFVGQGTHPSYGYNFPGRNMALDVVGDGVELRAEKIVDVSPDVMKAYNAKLDGKPVESRLLSELAEQVPGVFALSKHFADSNPLAHCVIDSEKKLDEEMKGYNHYHPTGDPISNAAVAVKNFFKRLCGDKSHKPKYKPKVFPVKDTKSPCVESKEAGTGGIQKLTMPTQRLVLSGSHQHTWIDQDSTGYQPPKSTIAMPGYS